MPYKNEHACSLRSIPPGTAVRSSTRVMRGKSVRVIWVRIGEKMRMASVRMKTGIWKRDSAAALCKSLGGTFHPAKKGD